MRYKRNLAVDHIAYAAYLAREKNKPQAIKISFLWSSFLFIFALFN